MVERLSVHIYILGEVVHALGHAAFMMSGADADQAAASCDAFANASLEADAEQLASGRVTSLGGAAAGGVAGGGGGAVASEGARRAEAAARRYYCVQGVVMEAARKITAKWCIEASAPGPCFAYWWLQAPLRPGLGTAAGKAKALTYCLGLGRGGDGKGGRPARLGCVYGAAATSTHPLVPRSPQCDAATLVPQLR